MAGQLAARGVHRVRDGDLVRHLLLHVRIPQAVLGGGVSWTKFLGTGIELKTALVIGQIVGYALSKYMGIKVCPEVSRCEGR